jgi:hypothetical protein
MGAGEHNPRLHVWNEHFALDGVRVVGLTAIGRTTVELLNMKEEERLNVPAALMERGEFD